MTSRPQRDIWLHPDSLFDGTDLHSGKVLHLREAEVAAVLDLAELPAGAHVTRLAGCISPGFFDIQVNGGGDVMFNTTPTPEGLRTIAAAHRQFGTTALLPTVITDRPEVLEAACYAMAAAYGKDGIMGIHIEGPHISMARRGTHAAKYVRPLDEVTTGQLRWLRDRDIPTMITVAPEAVAPGQIRALCDIGVVVSLGHSDTTAAATRAAVAEGAATFTHLFNAMSPMLNRSPGVTGAAINSKAYCSIICDGIHVEDSMVGLAMRARPKADRMILVSDAMSTVGGSPQFELYGQTITLQDRRLVNAEGSLAGAHITMAESVHRLVHTIGMEFEFALRCAITNPARLMGLGAMMRIVPGTDLPLILVRPDGSTADLAQVVAH
jgi:N-acetylglucosamine-6-phosphate deacetylase